MNPLLDQLKEKIRCKISDLNYNTWFRPILDATVKDGTFVLVVPNKFVADWINDYYNDVIRQELFGITQNKLAVSIGVPPRRINEIVHGKRGITADTAIRLARYFGTSEELWMNLQSNYELRLERRALRDKVAAITPLHVA